jgi:hypothetical protein
VQDIGFTAPKFDVARLWPEWPSHATFRRGSSIQLLVAVVALPINVALIGWVQLVPGALTLQPLRLVRARAAASVVPKALLPLSRPWPSVL